MAHFTGREGPLAQLDAALSQRRAGVITRTITGLGGVGKTQLAAAYAAAHQDEFDIAAWVRASDTLVFLANTDRRCLPVFDNAPGPTPPGRGSRNVGTPRYVAVVPTYARQRARGGGSMTMTDAAAQANPVGQAATAHRAGTAGTGTAAGTDLPRAVAPHRKDGRSLRRAELAQFLRARRERLTPAQVGLPPGPRRRTPGLRREELALLAGVGITWYTWLEQGRPINASMQVLDAVAQTLRLDRAEREHLYRLAEATPVRSFADSAVIPPAVLEILSSFSPCPAVLVNGRFDVLESNDGHQAVFRDWHSMPCIHRNLLWCGITEPSAREKFVNYDDEVPYLVARLRASYAAHIGDPEWEEDIRRLAELSPAFARLWARHEVAEPQMRLRIFRHPDAGELRFIVSELEVSALPGTRLLVYTPEDSATRARLPSICPSPAPGPSPGR